MGVLARLAAKSLGISPVIYTAHGFHFYKGAPIINWLLYYPVEKWLSRYTDALITINQEDYHRAKKLLPSSVFVQELVWIRLDLNLEILIETEKERN